MTSINLKLQSFLTGLHFDGFNIGEHVQPEERHHPDEAHSQPGRHEHEVHELKELMSKLSILYTSAGKFIKRNVC